MPERQMREKCGLALFVRRLAERANLVAAKHAVDNMNLKSSNVVWTAEVLDQYLQNPQAAIPGNRMPFSGIPQADKRADIIAYLATIK